MKSRVIALVSMIVLVAGFAACSQVETNFEKKSFSVQAGGRLHIDSDAGSLDISTHSRNTVDVDLVQKGGKPSDVKVEFSHSGSTVNIVGEVKRSNFGSRANVKFIIKVPEQYNLDLTTGGGSISVADLRGELKAHTSGGSIRVGHVNGDVSVKTSGGSIHIEDVVGNLNAHTSGGSIVAKISKQPTADSRLTTSGGSITARLLPTIAVDVKASTSGGYVKSEFNIDGRYKKSKLDGKVNGGGPELLLKTSGGNIKIKKT